MPDYETGTPSWDLGSILTRHHDECMRKQNVRMTGRENYDAKMRGARPPHPSEARLSRALATRCSCGMGDSDTERTSIIRTGKAVPEQEVDSESAKVHTG